MSVKAIPDGYSFVTPYLTIRNAAKAIELYVQAFGAEELYRLPGPGGMVMHAEMNFHGARIMLSDEFPEMGAKSPEMLGGTSVGFCLYVQDVDAATARAQAAGMTIVRPPADQFYGDRTATLVDPFGHKWTLATHVEDVSPEEMMRRMSGMGG